MKIGTKSLLFGAHQFILHPIFTFFGWIRCYGFDSKGYKWWKLLICFIIHDWGYYGCDNMDGKEGERHPKWAAMKVWKYLDSVNIELAVLMAIGPDRDFSLLYKRKYYDLCLHHSRFLAKNNKGTPSKLCWADKAGTALMPTWLWILLCTLTGELEEYTSVIKYKEKLKIVGELSSTEFFNIYKEHVKELINKHC